MKALENSIPVCTSKDSDQIEHFVSVAPDEVAHWIENGDFWGAYYEDGSIMYENKDGEVISE